MAIGILEETLPGNTTISFAQYILFDIPLVLGLLAVGYFILRWAFPPEVGSVDEAIAAVDQRVHEMGKTSLREKLVGAIMALTVCLWAVWGEEVGLANIAILSTASLFLLNLVDWKDVEENVNWGVLLMYGGAITLGSALSDTGAATWLTNLVLGDWQGSPELLMMTVGALTVLLTEFMSNSAVIAILMPAALSLAATYGIDPRLMTMAVILPSNFAFMLPMATPATAMAYSSGYFAPREAVKHGMILDLVGLCLLAFLVYVYWPLLVSFGVLAG